MYWKKISEMMYQEECKWYNNIRKAARRNEEQKTDACNH